MLVAERVVSSPHTWRWLWVSFFFYQFSLIDGSVGLLGSDCLCSIVTPPYSVSIQNPQGFDAILDSRIPVCASTVYFLIKVVNMKSNKKSLEISQLCEKMTNRFWLPFIVYDLKKIVPAEIKSWQYCILHTLNESLYPPFWALIANVVSVSFFFVVTF